MIEISSSITSGASRATLSLQWMTTRALRLSPAAAPLSTSQRSQLIKRCSTRKPTLAPNNIIPSNNNSSSSLKDSKTSQVIIQVLTRLQKFCKIVAAPALAVSA